MPTMNNWSESAPGTLECTCSSPREHWERNSASTASRCAVAGCSRQIVRGVVGDVGGLKGVLPVCEDHAGQAQLPLKKNAILVLLRPGAGCRGCGQG